MATSGLYIGISLALFDELLARKLEYQRSNGQAESGQDNFVVGRIEKYMEVSAVASFMTNILLHPIDTLRRRYQLQGFEGNRPLYTNSYQLISGVFKKDGLRCLYNGLPIGIVKTFCVLMVQGALRDVLENSDKLTFE